MPVVPTLNTIEDSYLITEQVELELEFYNEYDVLMQELEELENSVFLLSELEEDLNQAAESTPEDDSKLEIIKTKEEIKTLKEKINEIKANGEIVP